MIGRFAAAAAVSAAVAPAAFLPPPLYSAPPETPYVTAKSRFISQLGQGGFHLYTENCALCHGEDGVGTAYGPALTKRVYWVENLSRQSFHEALTADYHAGYRGNAQGRPLSEIKFNDVELIARYVREIQRPDLFN